MERDSWEPVFYFRLLDTAEEEKAQSGYQVKIFLKRKTSQIVYVVPKGFLNSRYVSYFTDNIGNVVQTLRTLCRC